MTEMRQSEGELRQSQAMTNKVKQDMQELVYVISHDFREPLRMITSFMELLSATYKGQLDQRADEFIGFAGDGAKRMEKMLDGLLVYARIETDGQAFESIDADKVLQRVLRKSAYEIEQVAAQIDVHELPIIQADEAQLEMLFWHLLNNALQFHDPRRALQITVSAEQRDQFWYFSLQDNGLGFESRQAERVFQVFQRLYSSDEHTSAGMGLPICKRIIDRHGGKIGVESTPGLGSTFWFTMPVLIS